jgi:hypothetical protein
MRLLSPLSLGRLAALLSLGLVFPCDLLTEGQQTPAPASAMNDMVKVDPGTEQVINGALKYLAGQQLPNGSWNGDKNIAGNDKYPIAMTSYVLIAFLANGNLPDGGPYAKQVRMGLQYLLDSVQADGTFQENPRGQYMYSHGLATLVLSEIYGETQSPSIRAKLEHVVLLIIHGQNPQGGWRYQPGSKDADLSVTVPQVVALCAAKRAGISVPQSVIDKAVGYIKHCQAGTTGGFTYQAGIGGPGFSRTSGAIYALQITGLFDDPLITDGSKFVMAALNRSPVVDWPSYGNYYCAVAHYLMGGDKWKAYYQLYGQYLLKNVVREGGTHWDATVDPHATKIGGNWPTAVATTILSLPYGYLPLYQR